MVAPAAIFCACVSRKRHSLRLCGVMKIGLAWCGGAAARGFKVRVLRWRSGGRALCCAGFLMGLIGPMGLMGIL